MISTIRLFKAVPITVKRKKKANKALLEKTIKKGFVFSPEVIYNYSATELDELIGMVEKELGLTAKQMNNSFHKSWKKVKEATDEQLIMEQIIHYITTYGFEAMGIYNEDSVYIPNEKLEIPHIEEIKLTAIKGYTKKELKEKLLGILDSGIALKEDTIVDLIDVANFVVLNETEIINIKNKEVKTRLYLDLGLVPEKPVEFLRFVLYVITGKSLIIKNPALIAELKENSKLSVNGLFIKYKKEHGLEKLAEIFYRFKPLFLALKTNPQMKQIINRIRKLAKKNHKPMKEDYLNEITAKLKKGQMLTEVKLKEELSKVNTFRKIRLAYALKFRTKDVNAILYRIRNGKGYATKFNFTNKGEAKRILAIVLDSITADIKKNVKGKKIYIPKHITYALPATEKQFTGDFPSGTYVTVDKDMVFGIHWDNVDSHRIDLDLSLINCTGKIGWDAGYRSSDKSILFSGDITAPPKNGASELFYVQRQAKEAHIMMVNYYNYDEAIDVPFKILIAKEQVSNLGKNYTVDPNKVLSIAKTKINKRQMILGLVVTTTKECRFYFAESAIGNTISSSGKDYVEHSKQYLFDFYGNTINLNTLLVEAGAKLVDDKEKCDIDLSPEELQKDSILNLIKAKNGR